ncbi:hypothetical protein H2203_001367 [Taxawa tesnikishii (nom. ined.)]|nr:hypothetical protein H2203_001367 [Dothideales sp. JES 119]
MAARNALLISRLTADTILTEFPPFDNQEDQFSEKHDSPFEFQFEDHYEKFAPNNMVGAGSPFIKPEPNDYHFNPSQFTPNQQQNGFSMGPQQNHFGNVDPSHLMNGNGFQQSFGSQNMSSSFVMGNSGIADDELLDGLDMDNGHGQHNFGQGQHFGDVNTMNHQSNYFNGSNGMNGIPMSMSHTVNSIYSSTPEGAPIQSPFVNEFNYGQFRPMNGQQQQPFSVPTQAGFVNPQSRAQHMHNMERKISDSRSPATPNTPGIGGLQLGEPEFPAPGVQHLHRHSASLSNNWDGTPSASSWNGGSPFASPADNQMHHAQISEVLKSNPSKIASSLPAKMEPGTNGSSYQQQEAKRRRRRESHNMVERRRRDNINERIQDLAGLVPHHRLEDEKVRKHLQTNSPLSPTIAATGISPPHATSLLAGGNGRRAAGAGSITTGFPTESKEDKGPNKGDILNSSVSWARDMTWMVKMKLEQEAQLEELVRSLGGVWPFERSEEEKRMRSEIFEVVQRNEANGSIANYSRAHGTGLRVPGFTNVAGDPVSQQEGAMNGSYGNGGLSPGFQSGSSGMNSGQQQFWQHQTSNGGFKEEDEFDLELQ